MRRALVLALLAGLGLSPLAAAAPSPSPSPSVLAPARGISVTPDPASPRRSKSGSFLELGTVSRGVRVADVVVVRSTFDSPRDVALYAADASPAVGGGFGFSGRSDRMTQVGAWLRVERSMVRVPPQGQVRVPVTLRVPPEVQGGEYVGAVIAEPVDQGPSTGVQTRTRFAMAVYLRVPGGPVGATPGRGRPDGTLQLLGVDPRFDGSRACPVVRLRNDSQDIVDPQVSVRAEGLLGSGSSYRRTRTAAVLPGSTAAVPLPCLRRPLGPGSIDIRIRSPRGDGYRAVDFIWLPASLVFASLLLLLLLAGLGVAVLRGRRRQDDDAKDGAPDRPG